MTRIKDVTCFYLRVFNARFMDTELFTGLMSLSCSQPEDMFLLSSPPPLRNGKNFLFKHKTPADNSYVTFSPVNAPLPRAGRKGGRDFQAHFVAKARALPGIHVLQCLMGGGAGGSDGAAPEATLKPRGCNKQPDPAREQLKMAMRLPQQQPVIRKVIQSH